MFWCKIFYILFSYEDKRYRKIFKSFEIPLKLCTFKQFYRLGKITERKKNVLFKKWICKFFTKTWNCFFSLICYLIFLKFSQISDSFHWVLKTHYFISNDFMPSYDVSNYFLYIQSVFRLKQLDIFQASTVLVSNRFISNYP